MVEATVKDHPKLTMQAQTEFNRALASHSVLQSIALGRRLI